MTDLAGLLIMQQKYIIFTAHFDLSREGSLIPNAYILKAKWHIPLKGWSARNGAIIIFKSLSIKQYFHNKRYSGLSAKNARIRYIFYIQETNNSVGD